MSTCQVRFMPLGKTVQVEPGSSVLDAALSAAIPLDHVCGACCSCTTCHVVIEEGFERLESADEDELERLSTLGSDRLHTSRLACQTQVTHDLVVRVPGLVSVYD